jgi:hypothetical protein
MAVTQTCLTDGEKMVWATAYEAEYRRWAQNYPGELEGSEAAKRAVVYATKTVESLRKVARDTCLVSALGYAFMQVMVAPDKEATREVPKRPPNQFLVPLDNSEVARLVAGAGSHSQLVRESASAQLWKIANLLGVEVE